MSVRIEINGTWAYFLKGFLSFRPARRVVKLRPISRLRRGVRTPRLCWQTPAISRTNPGFYWGNACSFMTGSPKAVRGVVAHFQSS